MRDGATVHVCSGDVCEVGHEDVRSRPRGAKSLPKTHERLRVPRAGFRNEPEVRERVFSVEVDDELNYLPIADLE